MRVPLPGSRFTAEQLPGGIRITIPAARSWFVILFVSCWLGGWYFGESSAIHDLLNPRSEKNPVGFLGFWLLMWTLGGLSALFSILWQLFGREVLETSPGVLLQRRRIGNLGISREYTQTEVRALRAAPPELLGRNTRGFGQFGRNTGAVAFDYGGRTIRIGFGLDEAEAARVVELLRPYYPRA